MEIRHLRLVRELAESGTLTAAGKRLFLSQPTLSRQLRAVEDELGTAVFHRMGRRLMLTPAGKRLHHGACRILRELEQTETDVKVLVSGQGGTLRLVTACYTCYHWLPKLLAKYRKKHPGVEVSINPGATADPYLSSSDLVPLHLTRHGIRRTWYAVALREDPLPPHVQAFIELLRDSAPLFRK